MAGQSSTGATRNPDSGPAARPVSQTRPQCAQNSNAYLLAHRNAQCKGPGRPRPFYELRPRPVPDGAQGSPLDLSDCHTR